MKKNKLLLLLALLMTAATGAWAQGPWTSGDCTATLSGGTLTISGNGAMADYTKIGNRPWNSNINSITSVVVEPGVTHIGRQAFLQFMNMTSVTLNEGLLTIGDNAFGGCNNASFTSITIPASVTSIGASIFSGCDNLATVTIADGSNLTTIGKSTFSGCLGLSSIEIPAGVTSIGNNAFNNCTNLATVTIPAGVTTIGNYAFQNCLALGSITLPAGVTSIGQNAFYGCSALATITLNSNPSIDATAFYGISPAVTMNLTATSADDAKWTTFYNQNYGFQADANTEVFKVVLSGTELTLNKVDNGIVDAGTAVVLKTTGGNPVMTLTTSASSDTQDNSLTGVSAAAGATSDGTFYVLDNGTSGLGFYKVASGGNVPVGNAYLTSTDESNFFSIGGGSDPAEPSTYTVTWDRNNISDINVYSGHPYSKEGITLSSNAGEVDAFWAYSGDEAKEGIQFEAFESGGFTFSNTLDKKFVKIEMTLRDFPGWDSANLGTGWAFTEDDDNRIYKATWTGDAASTVDLMKDETDFAGVCVKSIVFYFEGDEPEPASTYTVKMKDGVKDADKWTITPNEGLKEGDAVTLTYSGRLKVKGVKATVVEPAGNPVDLSTLTADYEAQTRDILSGTTSKVVTIAAGATITLNGATINNQLICAGDATIILADGSTNTVTAPSDFSNRDKAAVKIGGTGTTLTINGESDGTGSLTAKAGAFAAAIGTDGAQNEAMTGGNIEINGGTITATGGATYGCGIGTGMAYQGNSNTCGTITINGGTITATGGSWGAGIGMGINNGNSGIKNTCGAITIGTGVTMVTATKGSSAPYSIGKGGSNGFEDMGTITIGGTVYYDGSNFQNGGNTYLATSPFVYTPSN